MRTAPVSSRFGYYFWWSFLSASSGTAAFILFDDNGTDKVALADDNGTDARLTADQ